MNLILTIILTTKRETRTLVGEGKITAAPTARTVFSVSSKVAGNDVTEWTNPAEVVAQMERLRNKYAEWNGEVVFFNAIPHSDRS